MRSPVVDRKVICLALFSALIVAFAFGFSGCVGTEPAVALFYYNGEDPYINTFVEQIEGYAEGRLRITSYDARNSQTLQNEQINAVFSTEPDLIIVNPVDRLVAYTLIKRAESDSIPVVFFNREPLPEDLGLWDGAYYVGARAEQSARLQARLVIDLFGGDPDNLNRYDLDGDGAIQTVILKGEQGHQDAEIRTAEVLRAFTDASFSIDLLSVEVCNWQRDIAYGRAEEILEEFGSRVELVISNNDAMALGMIARMRQEGYFSDTDGNGAIDSNDERWVPVVGIDGLEEAVERIDEGYLYGTVKNDSQTMALAIVDLAEAVLNGAPLSELAYPPVDDTYIWIDYRPLTLD